MHHSTIEDLLISYYDGKATADEIQEIEAWIKLSDENKKKAMDIYTLLLMTDTQQITEKMDMNEELSKVKGRMQENKVSYFLVGIGYNVQLLPYSYRWLLLFWFCLTNPNLPPPSMPRYSKSGHNPE